MASDAFRRAFSSSQSNPLSGVAAFALQKAAERRLEAARRENIGPRFDAMLDAADFDGVEAIHKTLEDEGVAAELVLDKLIPELALRIGEQWVSDQMSFARVSVIAARLQSLAWRYIEPISAAVELDENALTMLLIVPEGETHTIGSVLAFGQMTRDGVAATAAFGLPDKTVLETLERRSFDAVGVSTSGYGGEARLSGLIAGLRARCRGAPVLLGGPILTCAPELASKLGADRLAPSARGLAAMLPKRAGRPARATADDAGVQMSGGVGS